MQRRRIGRSLEQHGLIERNLENAWLACAGEAGPLDDLIGHSITYRIAVGPGAGQTLFTLQTGPARRPEEAGSPNGAASAGGLSLYAEARFRAVAAHLPLPPAFDALGRDAVARPCNGFGCFDTDRLAAFYHWRDRQSLDQAVAVTASQDVDLDVVRRCSVTEGHTGHYEEFLRALRRHR